MVKKKVLFIMSRLPFPTSSGRKTSLYHYCRILHDELNCKLTVAAFTEIGDDETLKPDFIDRLIILPKPTAMGKIRNILCKSLIKKKYPLQVSLFLSQKAMKIVQQLMTDEQPDIVIGDMVRVAEYIRYSKSYTVADLDDRLSLRYKRQLEADIEDINPYGAFLGTLPTILRKILMLPPIKLAVVKNEIRLLQKYETEIGKTCNKIVFVAQKEATEFNREIGEEKAVAIPIGVNPEYFYYRECGKEGNYIGFLGAMNVAHNENAVRHFIRDIFPLILDKEPGAKFLIVGGGASDALLKLSSYNVLFTGYVDDVREYLEKCKVFVCPMTFGSGIKTKNIEAMCMGLPVVTTYIGAENIGANHGKEWFIEDNNASFANSVVSLLSNKDLRIEIGKKGSEYIQEEWTWRIAKDALKSIVGKA